MKLNKEKIIYLSLTLIQFILFLLLFINHNLPMNIINFSSIIFCFIATLLLFKKEENNIYQLLAITFTLIADVFLTLLGSHHTLAMFFFTIVQIFYLLRILLLTNSNREKKINLISRLTLTIFLLLIAVIVLKNKINSLIVISLIYYSNFIITLIFAFKHYKQNKLLAIGLLLFIICDTMIGLYEITSIFNLNSDNFIYIITHTSINIPWVFYIPAQTILVYSIKGC